MSILKSTFVNICLNFRQMLPKQPCLLCGSASTDIWCLACDASLPYLKLAHCPLCALPTTGGAICGRCLKHPPHFSHTVAIFAYTYPMDKLIIALKYGEKFNLAKIMGHKLSACVNDYPDCIVAMPLHPVRLRERGFNQSFQLARHIGRLLSIPVLPDACQRIVNTPSQSSLPWKQRNKNVHQAFTCDTTVAGKHVAVVDDVMTTGATLNELALALLNAGATKVSAWVVARTLPHADKK